MASKLVQLLDAYHPAIAGFPWDVGDERFPGMIELQAAFAHEEVAPLTGFDNGMVIYHHTVVDFFFVSSQKFPLCLTAFSKLTTSVFLAFCASRRRRIPRRLDAWRTFPPGEFPLISFFSLTRLTSVLLRCLDHWSSESMPFD